MFAETAYGAWIAFDPGLLGVLLVVTAGIDLVLLGLFGRGRKWHEHVSLFVAIFVIVLGTGFLMLQTVLDHPVVIVRDVFKIR